MTTLVRGYLTKQGAKMLGTCRGVVYYDPSSVNKDGVIMGHIYRLDDLGACLTLAGCIDPIDDYPATVTTKD